MNARVWATACKSIMQIRAVVVQAVRKVEAVKSVGMSPTLNQHKNDPFQDEGSPSVVTDLHLYTLGRGVILMSK